MKSFNVNKEIVQYLHSELERIGATFIFHDDTVSTDISGSEFHRRLKAAYCNKQKSETNLPEIPVYSSDILTKSKAVEKMYLTDHSRIFAVLNRDVGYLKRMPLEQCVRIEKADIHSIYQNEISRNNEFIQKWLKSDVDAIGIIVSTNKDIAVFQTNGRYSFYQSFWMLITKKNNMPEFNYIVGLNLN